MKSTYCDYLDQNKNGEVGAGQGRGIAKSTEMEIKNHSIQSHGSLMYNIFDTLTKLSANYANDSMKSQGLSRKSRISKLRKKRPGIDRPKSAAQLKQLVQGIGKETLEME